MAGPNQKSAPPLFVPRTVASFERSATQIASRLMAPVRTVGSRLLSFADRVVSNWAGPSSYSPSFSMSEAPSQAASRASQMDVARPWYETPAEVARRTVQLPARRPAPALVEQETVVPALPVTEDVAARGASISLTQVTAVETAEAPQHATAPAQMPVVTPAVAPEAAAPTTAAAAAETTTAPVAAQTAAPATTTAPTSTATTASPVTPAPATVAPALPVAAAPTVPAAAQAIGGTPAPAETMAPAASDPTILPPAAEVRAREWLQLAPIDAPVPAPQPAPVRTQAPSHSLSERVLQHARWADEQLRTAAARPAEPLALPSAAASYVFLSPPTAPAEAPAPVARRAPETRTVELLVERPAEPVRETATSVEAPPAPVVSAEVERPVAAPEPVRAPVAAPNLAAMPDLRLSAALPTASIGAADRTASFIDRLVGIQTGRDVQPTLLTTAPILPAAERAPGTEYLRLPAEPSAPTDLESNVRRERVAPEVLRAAEARAAEAAETLRAAEMVQSTVQATESARTVESARAAEVVQAAETVRTVEIARAAETARAAEIRVAEAEAARAETAQAAEIARVETAQAAEVAHAETARAAEAARAETARAETARVETVRSEAARAESETARQEVARAEMARAAEATRVETARAESRAVEVARVEAADPRAGAGVRPAAGPTMVLPRAATPEGHALRPGGIGARAESLATFVDQRAASAWGVPTSTAGPSVGRALPTLSYVAAAGGPARYIHFVDQLVAAEAVRETAPLTLAGLRADRPQVVIDEPPPEFSRLGVPARAPRQAESAPSLPVVRPQAPAAPERREGQQASIASAPISATAATSAAAPSSGGEPIRREPPREVVRVPVRVAAAGLRAEQLAGIIGVRAADLAIDFVDPAGLPALFGAQSAPEMAIIRGVYLPDDATGTSMTVTSTSVSRGRAVSAAASPSEPTAAPISASPAPAEAAQREEARAVMVAPLVQRAVSGARLSPEEWALVATFPTASTAIQLAAARRSTAFMPQEGNARAAAAPDRPLLTAAPAGFRGAAGASVSRFDGGFTSFSWAPSAAEDRAVPGATLRLAERGGAPGEYVVPTATGDRWERAVLPHGRQPRGGFIWPRIAGFTPTTAGAVEQAQSTFERGQVEAAPGTPLWEAMRPPPALVQLEGRAPVSEATTTQADVEMARPFLELVKGGVESSRSEGVRFYEQATPAVSEVAPSGEAAAKMVDAVRAQPQHVPGDERVSLGDLTLISVASATGQLAASGEGERPQAVAPGGGGGDHGPGGGGHGGGHGGGKGADLEELARKVYEELQRVIDIERERSGVPWER
jgi:hypothetical protein